MLQTIQNRRCSHWLPAFICILLFSTYAQADFALNFRPNTTNTTNTNNDSTDPKGYLGSDNDQGNSCGITGC